jgi:hypothetical protein
MFFTILRKNRGFFFCAAFKYWRVFSARYEMSLLNIIQKAAPWLKRLDVGLSSQMYSFDSGPFDVRFVGTQCLYDRFSPSISSFPCQHHLCYSYQKDTGRSLGTFQRETFFTKSRNFGQKLLTLRFKRVKM